MTRFAPDLIHIKHHERCSAPTRSSAHCKAMTNYVCTKCGDPICGRHHAGHRCHRPPVAP